MRPAHYLFIFLSICLLSINDTNASFVIPEAAEAARTAGTMSRSDLASTPPFRNPSSALRVGGRDAAAFPGPSSRNPPSGLEVGGRDAAALPGPSSRNPPAGLEVGGRDAAALPELTSRKPPELPKKMWLPYNRPQTDFFKEPGEPSSSAPQIGQQTDQKKTSPALLYLKKILGKKPNAEERAESSKGAAGSVRGRNTPTVEAFTTLVEKHRKPYEQAAIAQEVVHYLLNHEVPEAELKKWVDQMIAFGEKSNAGYSGEFRTTLFYGLHSLVLKYYKNPELRVIFPPLEKAMNRIKLLEGPQWTTQWDKELFNANSGLNAKFVDWQKLERTITNNPSLTGLRQGLANNKKDQLLYFLKDFNWFFHKNNGRYYSAESRVTAIAVLFHVRWQKDTETEALNLAQKLLVNKGDHFFLFEHEKALLGKLQRMSSPPPPPPPPPRPRRPLLLQ